MRELIEAAIIRKAKSMLRKQRIEIARARKYSTRYSRRTGSPGGAPSISDPTWWNHDRQFNPRYCIAHARYLSRTIWRKLQEGSYRPIPAIQFDIPKPDGTSRQIMAFAIPDAALANVLHKNITKRNINLFSAHSFAYRPDKGVFDAILHLRRSISAPKSYIIQYDFSKYFDTIDHKYLERLLFDRRPFLLTSAEEVAIKAFLRHRFQTFPDYPTGDFIERRAGVPQGSSLSLFLSNAAAHDLDLALERQNGTFVRFADDVVAITHTYRDAVTVSAEFRAHCKDAGLRINYEKSPGILLFGGGPERERRDFTIDIDDGARLESIPCIDYLGHRLNSVGGVGLPDKTVKRIKRRIAQIIYKHLFQHRRGTGGLFNPDRVGPGFVDWDLVTCINEIRNYMYGGLHEGQLNAFFANTARLPHVRGLMASLPLIQSSAQLRELDGWLLNVLKRAQRERARVVATLGSALAHIPEGQLVDGSWYDFPSVSQDMTLPSFVRCWRAAKKFYRRYGLSRIKPPAYYSLLSY